MGFYEYVISDAIVSCCRTGDIYAINRIKDDTVYGQTYTYPGVQNSHLELCAKIIPKPRFSVFKKKHKKGTVLSCH